MSDNSQAALHYDFLRKALEEAQKCQAVPTAFCVGCVIVTYWPDRHSLPVLLSTGYSREIPGNTHAEANALSKLRSMTDEDLQRLLGVESRKVPPREELLRQANVYTTMEPCSVRTSGLAPCADALVEAKIQRCFIGVGEPDDFVVCEGAQKLKDAGIEVVWLKGMEEACLAEARRGH